MSGGEAPAQTTTVSKSEPPAYLQPYLTDIAGRAQNWYNSSAPQYFPGQTYQSASDATNAGLTSAINRAQAGSPLMGAAQNASLATIRGDNLSPDSNPFLRDMASAAARPVVQNFNESVLPSVQSYFSNNGRYGSGANIAAVGRATDSLTSALSDQAANLYGGNYQAERGRQEAAIAGAPNLAAADYNDANALLQAGQTQEAYDTARRNAEIARFDAGQNRELGKLGAYSNIIYGQNTGGTQTQTQTVPQTGNSFLSGLFGGLSGLSSIASIGGRGGFGLWSDERLKEDVKRVGETDAGTPIYTYQYKSDPTNTTHMGVMAQEVRKKRPGAVHKIGPYLAVDYRKVA